MLTFYCLMYFFLNFIYVTSYLCFVTVFGVMQTSGMEHLFVIVYSLYRSTVFAESFILDVCTGSICVSGYFVLREATALLMQ